MSHLTHTQPRFAANLDIFFFSYYVTEMLLKMIVHRIYFFFNKDMRWNVFDFVLILLASMDMVMEYTSLEMESTNMVFMRSFRLIRLSRILRVFKVMRYFSEL